MIVWKSGIFHKRKLLRDPVEDQAGYLDHVAPLAACVPGPRNRPLCAKRVVASLHVNLAIRSDNEPVARTSRQIPLPTTDDEHVIANQIVFDQPLASTRVKNPRTSGSLRYWRTLGSGYATVDSSALGRLHARGRRVRTDRRIGTIKRTCDVSPQRTPAAVRQSSR